MAKVILDLSYWQGPWDFVTAKNKGVAGAIMKASGRAPDPMYAGNLEGLRANELQPGAYHYFYPASDLDAQVAMFAKLVDTEFSLGLWLDLEYNGPRVINGKMVQLDGKENNPSNVIGYSVRILYWLKQVEKIVGLKPGIYTSPGHALKHLRYIRDLADYDLWIANPQDSTGTRSVPNIPEPWPAWSWRMWQYSWKGPAMYYGGKGKSTGEGWSAVVDLNALRM